MYSLHRSVNNNLARLTMPLKRWIFFFVKKFKLFSQVKKKNSLISFNLWKKIKIFKGTLRDLDLQSVHLFRDGGVYNKIPINFVFGEPKYGSILHYLSANLLTRHIDLNVHDTVMDVRWKTCKWTSSFADTCSWLIWSSLAHAWIMNRWIINLATTTIHSIGFPHALDTEPGHSCMCIYLSSNFQTTLISLIMMHLIITKMIKFSKMWLCFFVQLLSFRRIINHKSIVITWI